MTEPAPERASAPVRILYKPWGDVAGMRDRIMKDCIRR